MRFILAPLAILCLLFSTPVLAQGGPDSIYVPGKGYVEPWQLSSVKQARHFGGYTKKAKRKTTKVAGKKFTPSRSVSYHSSAAPWLAKAKADVGKSARQLGVPSRLWCADFLNQKLRQAGYRGTGSRAAKSFLKYGRRTSARPGAIAIYSRGKRGGHVAIVESVNGNTVTLVSGNCGRKGVCRYTRSAGAALEYRWPS
jgi:uncharacterized protein (TIGR02594 family)